MRKLRGICIVTADVQRLSTFYQDVLEVKAEGEGDFIQVFWEGTVLLSIYNARGMEQLAPGSMDGAGTGSYALEFEVEDVDQEYERLIKKTVPIVKPPTTQPWGLRSVWFRDPDGNIINFFAKVAL